MIQDIKHSVTETAKKRQYIGNRLIRETSTSGNNFEEKDNGTSNWKIGEFGAKARFGGKILQMLLMPVVSFTSPVSLIGCFISNSTPHLTSESLYHPCMGATDDLHFRLSPFLNPAITKFDRD